MVNFLSWTTFPVKFAGKDQVDQAMRLVHGDSRRERTDTLQISRQSLVLVEFSY